ncbi:3'-5' exonuclease [Aquibacillus kalidii]|uniref:3'-5' exonuclease n=1 Tax=Aquibacillus kalidii TaxID=2762597 RepID=UPI00164793AF|nr:3'-5' exonuclease [Aquibacillus kalidii]
MNVISIDFETANRYRNSPCAVGIVVGDENGIIDEFYSLINPLTDFEIHNINVHGITEMDVMNAPTFKEIWPSIEPYLVDNIVVAHNASFDMSVLRATLDRFDIVYPDMQYFCSVMLAKQLWPGLPNYKLNTLADSKNISFSHHHALDDARVVVHLLTEAMREKSKNSVIELADSCQISSGKIFERSYITPKLRRKKKKSGIVR